MTTLSMPDETAELLEAAGHAEAAQLIRAMTAELATVRAERNSLAQFARSMTFLGGAAMTPNANLIVRAQKALDTLRVTERCPESENGKHRWMRRDDVFGSRCFSCQARRPGT